MFVHLKKNQKTSMAKPRGRWRDNNDEGENNKESNQKQLFNNKNKGYHPAFLAPKQVYGNKRNEGSKTHQDQTLIEDYLQLIGQSNSPSDKLRNDFENLSQNDSDKIVNELKVRVSNYKTYMTNQDSVKMLTRCLLLIEYFISNSIWNIYDAFDERIDLFENIIQCYSTNKKIYEICNNVIDLLSNCHNAQNVQDTSDKTTNLLELDIDFGQENKEGNLIIHNNDVFQKQNGKNIDLLDGIYNEQAKALIPLDSNNTFNLFLTDNTLKEVSSGIQLPSQKKGFNFIKSNSTSTNTKQGNMARELNDIFSNAANTFSISNSNANNNANPISTLTIASIESNLLQQSNPDLNNDSDITKTLYANKGPEFNYDHVYKNTNTLQTESIKQPDPFNFVNDILKSKK